MRAALATVARCASPMPPVAGGLSLTRPGFRCLLEDDAGAHAKAGAYADYETQLRDAYKTLPAFGGDPTIIGAGEHSPRGAKEGTPCTTGTVPAEYEQKEDEVPENTATHTEINHRDVGRMIRVRVYADHGRKLSETWRRL
jgi:hypothetical protein